VLGAAPILSNEAPGGVVLGSVIDVAPGPLHLATAFYLNENERISSGS